jgi:hypothetical protein
VVRAWPLPCTVRAVRGFLDMTGYYHKFIPSYDDIAAPLTQLKREAFRWSPEVAAAFNSLKAALTTALVLQLPNFTKLFLINCLFGTVQLDKCVQFSYCYSVQHSKE